VVEPVKPTPNLKSKIVTLKPPIAFPKESLSPQIVRSGQNETKKPYFIEKNGV
jgi:hypothetical protein